MRWAQVTGLVWLLLSAAWLTGDPVAAQPSELVFAQAGTMPILLTAPHGGNMRVPGVPERTTGTTTQDARTRELTEALAGRLEAVLCARPYVVIATFHRRYIDANRSEADAYEHPDVRPHYLAYHQSARRFVSEIQEQYPEGALLLDIHGQAQDPGRIHRGTNNGRSVTRLLGRYGEATLVGPNSIFGQLQAAGYDVFPPNSPVGDTREDPRWNGGYTVQTYGSHHPAGIDAIQIEIGQTFRGDTTVAGLAEHLANAIVTFAAVYLPQQQRCG
jgi:N-formylglutamate amidohydrolase